MPRESDDELQQIIAELKLLKLQQERVLTRLEVHAQRLIETSLPTAVAVPATIENDASLEVGDRIVIINNVRRPSNWIRPWSARRERHATVTRIGTDGKVFFTTDNGVKTWRNSTNVKKSTP